MATFSARGTVSVRPYVTVLEPADTPSEVGWSKRQILIVVTCFLINMLDGMDVLILSYIAPSLSADWKISPDQLKIVFSAGLAGMAAGGLLIAPLADRIGRRMVIIGCLAMMTVAMFGTAAVTSISGLILMRFIVGMGIGTVLASMAALTAEYAPAKHRTFAVGLLQAGYPIGATVTGFTIAALIGKHGWHAMLLGSGMLCAIALPLVWLALPESIEFLLKRQPKGALAHINHLRAAIGQPAFAALPAVAPAVVEHAGVRGLFSDGRARGTLLLWAAITFSFMTLYFVISWIPKLAVEAGLDPKDAIFAGAIYNIGAFVGTSSIGLIAVRFDLRRLVLVYMVCAAIALTVFGSVSLPLIATLGTAFLIGVFVQGGFNGLYPLAASLYPAEARGTGIGWAMGIGRIGAVIGPMLGGLLLADKVSLALIFGIFAVPVVLAGICAAFVRLPAIDR